MSDSDVTEPIWRAVAQLELQHYTKREIIDALDDVSDEMKKALDSGKMGE